MEAKTTKFLEDISYDLHQEQILEFVKDQGTKEHGGEYIVLFQIQFQCNHCLIFTFNLKVHYELWPACKKHQSTNRLSSPQTFGLFSVNMKSGMALPLCRSCRLENKKETKFCPYILSYRDPPTSPLLISCDSASSPWGALVTLRNTDLTKLLKGLTVVHKWGLGGNPKVPVGRIAEKKKTSDTGKGEQMIVLYQLLHLPTIRGYVQTKQKEVSLHRIQNLVEKSFSSQTFCSHIRLLQQNFSRNKNQILYVDQNQSQVKQVALAQHHLLLVQAYGYDRELEEWRHDPLKDGWWFAPFTYSQQKERLVYSLQKRIFVFEGIHENYPRLVLKNIALGMSLNWEDAETLIRFGIVKQEERINHLTNSPLNVQRAELNLLIPLHLLFEWFAKEEKKRKRTLLSNLRAFFLCICLVLVISIVFISHLRSALHDEHEE